MNDLHHLFFDQSNWQDVGGISSYVNSGKVDVDDSRSHKGRGC